MTLLWHDLRAPIHGWLDDRIGAVDAVLHLAAESHVDRSIAGPAPFIRNNVDVTVNMLEWARYRPGLTHFIQVSTDEVYGPAELHAHAEWDTIRPSNPYAASKACQEAVAFSYWRTYGLPVVIINIMNMFGERQDREKFVPKAIAAVLAGDEVPLHGRPYAAGWEPSSRCWLHARNFADALRWILTETTPAGFPQTDRPDRWHVAGDEVNVLEVAQPSPKPPGSRCGTSGSTTTSAARGMTTGTPSTPRKIAAAGWKPPVPLAESLERTVHWFRRTRSGCCRTVESF